jgi:hypothetical protein
MTADQHTCASCAHVKEGIRKSANGLRCGITGLAALMPCQRFEPSESGIDADQVEPERVWYDDATSPSQLGN